MKFVKLAFALSAIALAGVTAMAQDSTSVADQPARSNAAGLRIAPVVGASSMRNNSDLQTDFSNGFSGGIFADFGPYVWNFETGVETLTSHAAKSGSSASVNVNTWGIPLLAKANFTGNPHETVFVKAGIMPFMASGQDINEANIMAVGGVGGNIPLGKNSSILLDATYNRLFNQSGDLTNYQGIALLGGLSFNI